MSDQELKVGVVFEFKGIDDIEQIGVAVEKAMKSALGQFGVKGGVLEVRMANVDEFKAAIAQFNSVVQELAKTLRDAKVSVQPAEGSDRPKKTGGQSSGALGHQGRAQIDLDMNLSFDELVDQATKIASSLMAPLTPIERKLLNIKELFYGIASANTEFEQSIIATKLSVNSLEQSFSGFENKFRNAMGGAGSMILKSVQDVDNKFKLFGQRAVGGISIIDKTMSAMFRGNLNEMAKYLVSLGADIDNQLAEAQAEFNKVMQNPKMASQEKDLAQGRLAAAKAAAERGKATLDALAQDVDRMDGIIRRQEDQAKRRSRFERDSANIENRIAANLQSDFTKDIGNIIGEGDSASIRALTDNYEGLGRSLTNQIKQAEKLGESIRSSHQEANASISETQVELQRLQSQYNNATDDSARMELTARISMMQSVIDNTEEYAQALGLEQRRIEENIVRLKDRKVIANQMLETLRQERREAEEVAKANENAFRGAVKARRALEVASGNNILGAGLSLLDPSSLTDLKAAENALSKLDSAIIKAEASIKQMESAYSSQMDKIYSKAKNREGEFSVFGPDADLDAEQAAAYADLIDKQVNGLNKKMQREVENNELQIASAKSLRAISGQAVETFIAHAKSVQNVNNELDKQVGIQEKLKRARANLVSGTALLATGESDLGYAEVKLSADAYRSLNREIESIITKMEIYQAEGGALTADQLKTIQVLKEYQRESQSTGAGIDVVVSAMKRQIDTLDRLRAKAAAALENPMTQIGATGLGLDYKDAQDVKGVKDAISATRSELARLSNQKVQIEIEFKADTSKLRQDLSLGEGMFSGKSSQEANAIYANVMEERRRVHNDTLDDIARSEHRLADALKNTAGKANQDFLELAEVFQKLVTNVSNSEEMIRRFGKSSALAMRALDANLVSDFDFGLSGLQTATSEMSRYAANARRMVSDLEMAKLEGVAFDSSQEAIYEELIRTEEAAIRFSNSMGQMSKDIKLTKQTVDGLEDSLIAVAGNPVLSGKVSDLSVDFNLDLAKRGIKTVEASLRTIEQTEYDIKFKFDEEISRIKAEAVRHLGRFSDLSGDTAAVEARRLKIVKSVTDFYDQQISKLAAINSTAKKIESNQVNQLRQLVNEEEATRKINELLREGEFISAKLVDLAEKENSARHNSFGLSERASLYKETAAQATKYANRLDSITAKVAEYNEELSFQSIQQIRATASLKQAETGFRSYARGISEAEKRSADFDKKIDQTAQSLKILAASSSLLQAGDLDLSVDFDFQAAKSDLKALDKMLEEITKKKRLAVIEISDETRQASIEARSSTGRFTGTPASEIDSKLLSIETEIQSRYERRIEQLDEIEQKLFDIINTQGRVLTNEVKQEELRRSSVKEIDKIQGATGRVRIAAEGVDRAFKDLSSNLNSANSTSSFFSHISSMANSAQRSIRESKVELEDLERQGAQLDTNQIQLKNSTNQLEQEFIQLANSTKSLEDFLKQLDKTVDDVEKSFNVLAAHPVFNGRKLDINVKSDRDIGQKLLKDLEGAMAKIEAKDLDLQVDLQLNLSKLKKDRAAMEGIFKNMLPKDADNKLNAATQALVFEASRAWIEINKTRQAAKDLFDSKYQDLFNFNEDIKDLEKVDKLMDRIDKAQLSIKRNSERQQMAEGMMSSGDNLQAIAGIQQMQKVGSEARSIGDKILELDMEVRELTASNIKLTTSQRQKVDALLSERGALLQLDAAVRKRNEQLERQKRLEIEVGQALQLYNDRTADSIRGQFAFINALTVVTSVVFGVRMAFTELINESRAFARTLTVMESKTNDFATVYENLKTVTREVSVEFGRSIDEVAEIVKQFGSAGFSAEEAMSALRSTTQLIVATNGDAETSARAIAGIYRVFGKELKQTGSDMAAFARINDVLLGVYKYHQAELDEMVQGFRFAGSASKLAGFTFSETSAMLAVLNDNMIKSGTAGRGLQVVLAQVAAKSDQFQAAFGVTIDRGAPLTDQFLSMLGQVNAQLSSGVYTIAELDKRFKLFGLRGARSFAVLAEQFPAVLEAMQRLDKETKGLGNNLSQIVKNELATQFDSAKQALIGIAREFIEPLKSILVIFVDLIKGARDLFIAFDPISSVIASVIFFTAILATLLMTLKAVLTVIVVMSVQLGVSTKALIGEATAAKYSAAAHAMLAQVKAGATISQVVGAGNLVLANKAVAGSAAGVAQANTAMAASTVAGSAKLIAFAAVAVAVVGLLIYFSHTSRSLRSELDELAGSLATVENNLAELNRFQETLNTIQRSTLTPDAKANSLLQILEKTNKELIRGGAIANQTRDQIATNINANIIALQKEADVRKRILDRQKEQKKIEVELKQLAVVDKEITGFDLNKEIEQYDFWKRLKSNPFENMRVELSKLFGVANSTIREGGLGSPAYLNKLSSSYEDAALQAKAVQDRIQNLQASLLKSPEDRGGISRGYVLGQIKEAQEELESMKFDEVEKRYTQELDKIIRVISEAGASLAAEGQTAKQKSEEIFKTLFENRGFDEKFVSAVRKGLDREFFIPIQFKLAPQATADINDLLYTSMVDIVNTIDAPLPSSVFGEVAEDFVRIQNEVELAGEAIKQMQGLIFQFDSQTNVSAKATDQFKKAKDLLDANANSFQTLNEEAQTFSVRTDSVDGFLSGLEEMTGLKTISMTNESLMAMMTNIASLQDLTDQSTVALSNSFWKNITDKKSLADAMFEEAGGKSISSSEKMEVSIKDLAGAYLKTREAIRSLGNETESVLALNASYAAELANAFVNQFLPEIEAGYRKLIGGIRSAIMSTADLNPLEQMLNRSMALQQQLTAQQLRDGSKVAAYHEDTILKMSAASGRGLAVVMAQEAHLRAREAEALQSLQDRINDASETLAKSTGDEEAEKQAEKQLDTLVETYKKLADIAKIRKEISLLKIQEAVEQRKINQSLAESIRFGKRAESLSKVKIRSLVAEIQYSLEILKVQELLGRSQEIQQYFISGILERVGDILEIQNELMDSVAEEVASRYEAMALIKQSLDSSNKVAGVQQDITAKAAKLNRLLFDSGHLEKQLLKNKKASAEIQSEIDNNLAEQAKILTDILSHEEKYKKLNEEKRKSLENQYEVYKEIADLLGNEVSRAESALSDSISNRIKNMADDEMSARQLARAAGVSVNDAIYRREEVIETLFKRMKKDYIPTLGEMSEEFRLLGQYITDTAKRQAAFLKTSQSLAKDQASIELESYYMNLGKNTKKSLEDAGKNLEKFKSLISDAFVGDPEDPNFEAQIAALNLYIQKRRELQSAEMNVTDEANLNLTIAGLSPEEFFNFVRERLQGIFNTLSEVASDDGLLAILRGEYQAAFGLNEAAKKSFETSVNTLVDSLNSLSVVISTSGLMESRTGPKLSGSLKLSIPGFQTGGRIPGYGGGDIIPAMLEPGEFVIPKHIVKKMGSGFFEQLRVGNVPGFQSGGNVGNVASSEYDSLSADLIGKHLGAISQNLMHFRNDVNKIATGLYERINTIELITGVNYSNPPKIKKDLSAEELVDRIDKVFRSGDLREYLYTEFVSLHRANATNAKVIIANLKEELSNIEFTVYQDEASTKKLATGGRIPGYGGGDTIPAMLEPGEFVIPKHIVKKMGSGFFEQLRVGNIPGFSAGTPGDPSGGSSVMSVGAIQIVNAVDKARESIDTKLASADENISGAIDRLQSSVTTTEGIGKPVQKALQAALKVANRDKSQADIDSISGTTSGTQNIKASIDFSKVPSVKKELDEWVGRAKITGILIEKGLQVAVGGINLIASEISGYLVPEFAAENARLRKELLESIKQINKQYQDSVQNQIVALQRNESTYYAYLNAIQDAERSRQQQILDAQDTYRESLKKTGQVMMEIVSNFSASVLSGAGDIGNSIAESIASDLKEKVKGAIAAPFISMSDAVESLFKGKTDPTTNTQTGGVATGIKNGVLATIDGVSTAINFLKTGSAELENMDPGGGVEKAAMSFEEFANKVGAGTFDLLQKGAELGTMLSGFALGAVTDFVSKLITMSMSEDSGKGTVDFVEKFITELPNAAPAFIDKLIENADRLLTAISEGMPMVIGVLLEEAPRFLEALVTSLEQNLPNIIQALADALPILIQKLVPILSRLVMLVISQIPVILEALAESIPTLMIEVLKQLPMIALELLKAIITAIPRMIGGFFSGIFGGIFHQGGVVNTPTQEALILAKKGEGILTPETVRRIGGASAIQALNAGMDPNQLAPNIVDPMNLARQTKIEKISPTQNQNNSVVNNSFSMSVPITGNETDRDLRAKADTLIEMVDEGLTRLAKDRKSKFARRA